MLDADGKETGERKPISLDEHLEELRHKLNNEALPKDEIKIFSLLPVSNRFNAKNNTNYREYSYFLPTYMLTPINKMYLATPPKALNIEEEKEKAGSAMVVKQITSGIKKIIRRPDKGDERDNDGGKDGNPITHLSKESIDQMYQTRLDEETKTQLHEQWAKFEGTKKYHNFTKEIKPHEEAAKRYMMKMTAN